MKLRPEIWRKAKVRGTDHRDPADRSRRFVLTLDQRTGATILAPVEIVEDMADGTPGIMPGECAHPTLATWSEWMREEGTPGDAWHVYGCRNCGVAGPGAPTPGTARRAFLAMFPPATGERIPRRV